MARKHSVLLKEEKCEGCTNCVKKCPTKAIRVHQGKARIKNDLCIDCAECIRTCAYHAKYTKTDESKDIDNYEYPVVLVPPSFYGQFKEIKPVEVVAGLHELGFKEVVDVALAAEALSHKTIEFLKDNKGSYISSSCPVVVRLIKLSYQELIDYLVPFKSPVELMAQVVKRKAEEKGIDASKIGIFFITPCPAKSTTIYQPLGMEKSYLDKALAVEEVYQKLVAKIEDIREKDLDLNGYTPPYLGIGWGQSGGEAGILALRNLPDAISISGIHNVKSLLEEISRNNVNGIKYFELTACSQGCVGGVLNVRNPFQAGYEIKRLARESNNFKKQDFNFYDYRLARKFKPVDAGKLDEDLQKAMDKLNRLEKEIDILPGLDCAACGAPDCETLAEDIVTGMAQRADCIFVLRQKVEELADKMSALAHALPPVISNKKKGEEDKDEGK